ncbi:MAG TPA: histidine kinase dimerization/phospho-acceptor domain-containing protein, partial [Opitutales bacterium]|nr:histidine kinase dimerization/phospho-acceptor domain-containing protein [Opitutales bacterium]
MLFQTHRHKARTPEEEVLTSRIDGELDRLFVTQAHTSSLTGLFSALIFTVIILPHHLTAVFILWTLSMVALYLSRFFWLGSRLRKGPDGCRGAQVRSGIYFNIALMGVGWGCAAWTFIWPHELVTQLPFLMILLGILTLTPPILSTKPLAGYLFVLPLLAGLILRLHTEAPEVIFATSAVAVLLAAFALGVTHRHSYILRRGIAQRIEKESIFDRLVEAKLRAEESASAKSTFIATMSHEIRTPVNGLMGMLEILKDTELTSQQANYLNTASRSAESLLQLLNDILDYSKLEVGKLELDKIPFDWVAMTGEIAMMNRVLALDKGVGFHLEIPPEATSIVVGDPVRLRQILNNLLSNAMKFTSEGSIWLKVHVDNEDAKTVRLSFS